MAYRTVMVSNLFWFSAMISAGLTQQLSSGLHLLHFISFSSISSLLSHFYLVLSFSFFFLFLSKGLFSLVFCSFFWHSDGAGPICLLQFPFLRSLPFVVRPISPPTYNPHSRHQFGRIRRLGNSDSALVDLTAETI